MFVNDCGFRQLCKDARRSCSNLRETKSQQHQKVQKYEQRLTIGSPVEFECSTTRTTLDNDEVSFVAAIEWPPAGEFACFTATPPFGTDFDGLGDSGKAAGWPGVDCLAESDGFETTTGWPSMGEHVYRCISEQLTYL
jgi:hypothetical protein